MVRLMMVFTSFLIFEASFPSAPVYSQTQQAPLVQWIGIAISPKGDNFTSPSQTSEINARNAAKTSCELKAGSTCVAIAVPMTWEVSALKCTGDNGPQAFIAGSGLQFAKEIALEKAKNAGFDSSACKEIYKY